MSRDTQLSRRTVLRGLGTAVALPFLEAMAPPVALAGSALGKRQGGAPPVRMALIFVPNGVHLPDWTPSSSGSRFELPFILEPLR